MSPGSITGDPPILLARRLTQVVPTAEGDLEILAGLDLSVAQGETLAITVLDVGAVLARVRELLAQAAAVVRYVFLFSLAAGLLVLAVAILASLDERRREVAVLRVLGAGRGQLLGGSAVEFAVLGGIAGLVGALGAWVARAVLGLSYVPDPGLVVMGVVAGAAMVVLAGLAGTWRLVRVPPMASLRG